MVARCGNTHIVGHLAACKPLPAPSYHRLRVRDRGPVLLSVAIVNRYAGKSVGPLRIHGQVKSGHILALLLIDVDAQLDLMVGTSLIRSTDTGPAGASLGWGGEDLRLAFSITLSD